MNSIQYSDLYLQTDVKSFWYFINNKLSINIDGTEIYKTNNSS